MDIRELSADSVEAVRPPAQRITRTQRAVSSLGGQEGLDAAIAEARRVRVQVLLLALALGVVVLGTAAYVLLSR